MTWTDILAITVHLLIYESILCNEFIKNNDIPAEVYFCSQYNINNLPHPRFILLGPTGVGKSTLANQLLGRNPRNASETVFSVGDGVDSHTLDITWVVGNWLGDGPCFTIIDTPGSSDSEGRDYEHALTMANIMKNKIKSIDIFLLCFNGEKSRFDQSTIDLLKLYESIFSKQMWEHAVTEVTHWSHDGKSVRKRKRNKGIDEELRHKEWNSQYKDELNVTIEVPSVYIDPVLPIFDAEETEYIEEREKIAFMKYTNELYEYGKNITPFFCDGSCKAPNGYFLGTPWIKTNNITKKQGEKVAINCQIWTGIQGKASDNVTWTHNGEIIYMKTTTKHEAEAFINTTDIWGPQVKFFESISPGGGHYTDFTIHFESLEESMEGNYTCENGVITEENVVEIFLKEDGSWSEWGPWGKCSKSCLSEDNELGSRKRIRKVVPPRNGGDPVNPLDGVDTQICAGEQGPENLVLCPKDFSWNPWTEWSKCYPLCGDGTTNRARSCNQGSNGGVMCPSPDINREQKPCNIRSCPNCIFVGWQEWSQCSKSCLTGNQPGTRLRKRITKEADPDSPVCNPLNDGHTQEESCNTVLCPDWNKWSEWGECNVECGGGIRTRYRTCLAGSGKCPGKNEDTKPCNDHLCCKDQFICEDYKTTKRCISYSYVCDQDKDCADGSDEAKCQRIFGTFTNKGRVEIRKNGVWGTVCDDGLSKQKYGFTVSKSVCQEAKFHPSFSFGKHSDIGETEGVKDWISSFKLRTWSGGIDFNYIDWWRTMDYSMDQCSKNKACQYVVRLPDGSENYKYWMVKAGSLVSGLKEYPTVWEKMKTNIIHMDEVKCVGKEDNLRECRYTSDHNCDNSEDFFVHCNTKNPSPYCILYTDDHGASTELTVLGSEAYYNDFSKISFDNQVNTFMCYGSWAFFENGYQTSSSQEDGAKCWISRYKQDPGIEGVCSEIGKNGMSSARKVLSLSSDDRIQLFTGTWLSNGSGGTHRDDISLVDSDYNDKYSSIAISGSANWRIYEHSNFKGKSCCLKSSGNFKIYETPDKFCNMGNMISSIKKNC